MKAVTDEPSPDERNIRVIGYRLLSQGLDKVSSELSHLVLGLTRFASRAAPPPTPSPRRHRLAGHSAVLLYQRGELRRTEDTAGHLSSLVRQLALLL